MSKAIAMMTEAAAATASQWLEMWRKICEFELELDHHDHRARLDGFDRKSTHIRKVYIPKLGKLGDESIL